MAIRVSSPFPPSGTPSLVNVYRAPLATGTYGLIAQVTPPIPKDGAGNFFYDDSGGDPSFFYRILFLDPSANVLLDSGPFAPNVVGAADLPTLVKVDHDYGGVDVLRYCAPSGAGIPQANVRVYRRPDYLAGRTNLALAATTTDDEGRWVAPFNLEPGFDYVVVFAKPTLYGPDPVTITV